MEKEENITLKEKNDDILDEVTSGEYKYGFVTDIETDVIPAD